MCSRESTAGGHFTHWDFYVCENTSLVNNNWPNVKCLGMVFTYSERDGRTTEEESYFIMVRHEGVCLMWLQQPPS